MSAMPLKSWMRKSGYTPATLAAELKVARVQVYRWLWGDTRPDRMNRRKLKILSNGEVTADSFDRPAPRIAA